MANDKIDPGRPMKRSLRVRIRILKEWKSQEVGAVKDVGDRTAAILIRDGYAEQVTDDVVVTSGGKPNTIPRVWVRFIRPWKAQPVGRIRTVAGEVAITLLKNGVCEEVDDPKKPKAEPASKKKAIKKARSNKKIAESPENK